MNMRSLNTSIRAPLAFCLLFITLATASYPDSGVPVDGRGGYLWTSNITFPIYPSPGHPNGSNLILTWAELDFSFQQNEQINATAGICFGLCMLAFLNIITLTPKPKRGLPLYIFNLLALGTLVARYLTLMITFTALEVGSAYYIVAPDYSDGETIRSVVGIIFTIWLPPFALMFVVLCFYLQAKCVLVLIALKHKYVYRGIMSYLIGLSICTLVLRLVYAAYNTIFIFDFDFIIPAWMNLAVVALYTATILSWSLIFSWQVGLCIFNRCKTRAAIDRHEAMTILFMTGIESMIIPMIFTIMQLCNISWFLRAEYLIMPSIACIIPFGSIWAGMANTHAQLQRVTQSEASSPTHCSHCSALQPNTSPDTTLVSTSHPHPCSQNAFSPSSQKTHLAHPPIIATIGRNSALPGLTPPTAPTGNDPLATASASKSDIRSPPLARTAPQSDITLSHHLPDARHARPARTRAHGGVLILPSKRYGVDVV